MFKRADHVGFSVRNIEESLFFWTQSNISTKPRRTDAGVDGAGSMKGIFRIMRAPLTVIAASFRTILVHRLSSLERLMCRICQSEN